MFLRFTMLTNVLYSILFFVGYLNKKTMTEKKIVIVSKLACLVTLSGLSGCG
jgi:hypothetical protein